MKLGVGGGGKSRPPDWLFFPLPGTQETIFLLKGGLITQTGKKHLLVLTARGTGPRPEPTGGFPRLHPATMKHNWSAQCQYKATLKKTLFPVARPGDFISAEWDFFFFHFAHFIIFLPKIKKKKKRGGGGEIVAARLATISATRYTGNKPFFKG